MDAIDFLPPVERTTHGRQARAEAPTEDTMTMIGSTIGRIRLIELAGKGGMGEVFVGYDETLGRKVAVKCVSQDYRFNHQVAGRILREARILSRLAHPNICQIYDLIQGNEGDFLILELVDGQDLKQAMAQGLDAKSKLRVAQQIADVLVAAHAEGVIHRDLKPDNIMLTLDGNVKVLDFGIARSLDLELAQLTSTLPPLPLTGSEESGKTQPMTPDGTLIEARLGSESNVMGTPRYMSPEQARAEPITPASDMYSFGLLLQELLTEKSPYRRRQPLPTLLLDVAAGRSLPVEGQDHDITQLINRLKSLEPRLRPTAKGTADRLRWIRERPVRRLRRALAAAIVLLVVGLSVKYTLDLDRERQAAVTARGQAEDLVAYMLEDLSGELEPVGKLDLLGKVAHKALDHLDRTSMATGGESAFLRGQAFHNVAMVLSHQSDLAQALDAVDGAIVLHRSVASENRERLPWQVALAEDHLLRGNILSKLGRTAEAQASIERALISTADLIAQHPDERTVLEAQGEAFYSAGLLQLFIDDTKAEPYFRQAIELFQGLRNRYPEDHRYPYRLAVLYGQGLGQLYQLRGLDEESLASIRQAYDLYRELLATGTFNGKWWHGFAWENRRLGDHFQNMERLPEALASYREALEITERLLTFEPSQGRWRLGLGIDHLAIGEVQQTLGQLDEALRSFGRASEVIQALADDEPSDVDIWFWQSHVLIKKGVLLEQMDQQEEARAAWQRAATLAARHGEDLDHADPYLIEVHARALLLLQRVDEATPLIDALRRRAWFPDSADDALIALCQRFALPMDAIPSE